MAGQLVLQKVPPELEVILVAGLLVPDRKRSHLKDWTLQHVFVVTQERAKEQYLQETNVIDKKFDPQKKDEGGCRHFLPAIWSNFGNLGVIVQKEKLIICPVKSGRKNSRVDRNNV